MALPNTNQFYFTHAIDMLKGWPSPTAVDFSTLLSSNVTGLPYSGRVAHVNSVMQFELGAKRGQMACFLIPGANDYDVQNVNPGGAYGWNPVAPNGHMSALVAIGGYEIESTEYDATATYAINDLLHSPTEDQITGADKSGAGLLYNHANWPGGSTSLIAVGTNSVCGVVSRGARVNALRQNVLTFWPVWYPGPANE